MIRDSRSDAYGYFKGNPLRTLGVILISLALAGCASTLSSVNGSSKPTPPVDSRSARHKSGIVQQAFTLQMPFIANEGQLPDERVRFYAQTFAGTVYVTGQGEVVYSLQEGKAKQGSRERITQPSARTLLKETLVGGAVVSPTGVERAETRVNSFIVNDRSRWRTASISYR